MKNYILLLLCVIIASCKPDAENTNNYILLSGNIEGQNGGELYIRSQSGVSELINIKSDGTFIDTLYVDDGVYTINFNKLPKNIYLAPGDSIHITAEAHPLLGKSLQFSGSHASFNNYFSNKGNIEIGLFMVPPTESIFTKEESDFIKAILEIKSNEEQMLDAVTDITDELRALEKRSIYYAYLKKKSMYGQYYAYVTQNPDFKTSDGFNKELDDLSLDNAKDYVFSNDYAYFVSNDIGGKANMLREKDSISYAMAVLLTASEISNDTIRNIELFSNINNRLPTSENKKEFYDEYMKRSTNDFQKEKITELYKSMIALESGQPSPKFMDYIDHAGGTKSLDDFKGKFVYIDVWATWCGPCLREVPFLKEVEKEYHDKNIEFVSISIDVKKDFDKWKKMVVDKELTGTQLFADNNFNSEFIQAYGIRGIPRFILVDPQGNIVKASAPLPSDKKLTELFNNLEI